MRGSEHVHACYEPELDAVYGLLVAGAEVIADDGMPLAAVLETGAECECAAVGLPIEVTAWWVADEAAYRIARTCGFVSAARGRGDPAVATAIAALARQPERVQIQVLRAAARTM